MAVPASPLVAVTSPPAPDSPSPPPVEPPSPPFPPPAPTQLAGLAHDQAARPDYQFNTAGDGYFNRPPPILDPLSYGSTSGAASHHVPLAAILAASALGAAMLVALLL